MGSCIYYRGNIVFSFKLIGPQQNGMQERHALCTFPAPRSKHNAFEVFCNCQYNHTVFEGTTVHGTAVPCDFVHFDANYKFKGMRHNIALQRNAQESHRNADCVSVRLWCELALILGYTGIFYLILFVAAKILKKK